MNRYSILHNFVTKLGYIVTIKSGVFCTLWYCALHEITSLYDVTHDSSSLLFNQPIYFSFKIAGAFLRSIIPLAAHMTPENNHALTEPSLTRMFCISFRQVKQRHSFFGLYRADDEKVLRTATIKCETM